MWIGLYICVFLCIDRSFCDVSNCEQELNQFYTFASKLPHMSCKWPRFSHKYLVKNEKNLPTIDALCFVVPPGQSMYETCPT